MAKRLIFACLSLLFILLPLFTPSVVVAGENPFDKTDQTLRDFCNRRKGNQINLETWYSGKCGTTGPESIGFADIIIMDLYERVAGEQKDNTLQMFQELMNKFKIGGVSNLNTLGNNGLLNDAGSVISFMYTNPPASSIDYLAGVQNNLAKHNIVQPAYAQNGFGFQALSPVLEIWRAMRNIAYFVFILAFVMYGFMIMFRIKIDPKTVATIENSIPKIIGTLLIITFSYAIVGLMIDFSYVITGLIFSAFGATGIVKTDWWNQWYGGLQSGSTPLGLFGTLMMIWAQLFSGGLMPRIINGFTSLPVGVAGILDLILNLMTIGIIIKFIIAIAVAYSLFKLGYSLLKSYIEIILSTAFAPMMLLGDLMPGNDAFGSWSRGILANLSAFVVSQILFALSFYFMGGFNLFGWTGFNFSADTAIWRPPLILTGGGEGVKAIIGLGIILMASKFVDMIKDALKIPPFKYGTAIGEALDFGYGKALRLNEAGVWKGSPLGGGEGSSKLLTFLSENAPSASYKNKLEREKTKSAAP